MLQKHRDKYKIRLKEEVGLRKEMIGASFFEWGEYGRTFLFMQAIGYNYRYPSKDDYEFAKEICVKYDLYNKTKVLFSAAYGQIEHSILAEKMVIDCLPARLQIQLHKVLWGNEPGK